jgi:hypothetical protein
MITHLLSTSSAPPERSPKSLSPNVAASLSKWTTRSMKYSRTYHLTFSLFTPTAIPSNWDIEAALEEHMKPLLESFSAISNFTIDTQVQLYATPGVSGKLLKKEDLSAFINAAEWPLSPSIGGAPTVNFIVYVGDMEVEGGGKSWLIPQWGGVVIQSDVFQPTHVTTGSSRVWLSPLTSDDVSPRSRRRFITESKRHPGKSCTLDPGSTIDKHPSECSRGRIYDDRASKQGM